MLPFGAEEFAAMERRFAREHIERSAAAAGADGELRRRLVAGALADVADGQFQFGRARFLSRAMAAESAPMLLRLSLRARRPDITERIARDLLARQADGGASVMLALWRMLGIGDSEKGAAAGVSEGAGNARSPHRALPSRKAPPRRSAAVSAQEREYRAMLLRREMFDRVCTAQGWTTGQLLAQPTEALAETLKRILGLPLVDTRRLPDWTREYARRKVEQDAPDR
jgi:hypothetical protein